MKNIGQPHVPLGLQIGLKDKYLFNGKELQEDFGLYQYDFGARTYDPQLARWFSVDPMAHLREWVSPYNFVQNNPINRIDPDGRLDKEYDVDLKTGEVKEVSDKGGDDTHYFNIIETSSDGEKSTIAQYELNTNEFGLVPFPESGDNWGRYGNRDAGGDNWASPETAGAFFGLLYDWSKSSFGDKVLFDDISGNKGQDIGHTTHRSGDDIDIRYFGAGSGPNLNSRNADCSTCWNSVSKINPTLKQSTNSFLNTAGKWGFNQNYAYPRGLNNVKNGSDKLHFIHRHHLHLGRR